MRGLSTEKEDTQAVWQGCQAVLDIRCSAALWCAAGDTMALIAKAARGW